MGQNEFRPPKILGPPDIMASDKHDPRNLPVKVGAVEIWANVTRSNVAWTNLKETIDIS